jgi:hypothetical protein
MKNIIIPAVILSLFTCIGCMNNASTANESTGPVPTIVVPQPKTGDTNANKIQPPPVTTTPATIASKPVSTAALNPAHGQPGHRCDIAVGAPLDSKPAQTTAQPQPVTTTINPVVSTPTTTTTPVAAANGLNPAHGQPGHRCDIPVGSPLDSKPAPKQ